MSTPRRITGYVLAGGRSNRMGRDKALLPWPELPLTLLDHMIHVLNSVCDPVVVIGSSRKIHTTGIRWLSDRIPQLGPIGGIATALHDSFTSDNIVIAVDLPSLTRNFLKYFIDRCQHSDRHLTACKIGSAFPLCLGIRTEFKHDLDRYIETGGRRIQSLIENTPAEIVTTEELFNRGISPEVFRNINKPADYEAVLQTINRENP